MASSVFGYVSLLLLLSHKIIPLGVSYPVEAERIYVFVRVALPRAGIRFSGVPRNCLWRTRARERSHRSMVARCVAEIIGRSPPIVVCGRVSAGVSERRRAPHG
jgi:hypothetical protein